VPSRRASRVVALPERATILTDDELDLLRGRALRAWDRARMLIDASNGAVAQTIQITTASHTLRARARLGHQRKGAETID
jgi:hypothetical protein